MIHSFLVIVAIMFGTWETRQETDIMTDETTLFVDKNSEDGQGRLSVRCRNGRPELHMTWMQVINSKDVDVQTRFDKAASSTSKWKVSNDGLDTYIVSGRSRFLRDLSLAKRLIARLHPPDKKPITVVFDLDGFLAEVQSFQGVCTHFFDPPPISILSKIDLKVLDGPMVLEALKNQIPELIGDSTLSYASQTIGWDEIIFLDIGKIKLLTFIGVLSKPTLEGVVHWLNQSNIPVKRSALKGNKKGEIEWEQDSIDQDKIFRSVTIKLDELGLVEELRISHSKF